MLVNGRQNMPAVCFQFQGTARLDDDHRRAYVSSDWIGRFKEQCPMPVGVDDSDAIFRMGLNLRAIWMNFHRPTIHTLDHHDLRLWVGIDDEGR